MTAVGHAALRQLALKVMAQRAGPAIKLAPLPAAQQPEPSTGPAEPAPQKPDIKLPADAIRAGKSGSKPLSEHLRKHEARRKAETGGEEVLERLDDSYAASHAP